MNDNKLVDMKALKEIVQGLKNYTDLVITEYATKDYIDEKLSDINNNVIINYDEVNEELLMDTNFINVIYEEETENLSILG